MNWSKKHIKSYANIMRWYMKGTGEMYIGTVQEYYKLTVRRIKKISQSDVCFRNQKKIR